MAARTGAITATGITLAISATLPATHDAAGFGATTTTYTTVGEISNMGEHGGTAAVGTHTPVGTGVIVKLKGPIDNGTKSLEMASKPTDAGQVILTAAMASTALYAIKLTYPDNAIHYFTAIVSKNTFRDGAAGDTLSRMVDLAISGAIIEVAAA